MPKLNAFVTPPYPILFSVGRARNGGPPGGEAVLNVGGGVVADSTAAAEYEEALWKARFAAPFPPA